MNDLDTLMTKPDVYAVFVDVMGFAESIQGLKPEEQAQLVNAIGNGFHRADKVGHVATQYSNFCDIVKSRAEGLGAGLEFLMMFSDSAYLVANRPMVALEVAHGILQECLLWWIPVRVGVGRGSFGRLAFSTTSHPGGALVAEAPFVGTSIINAYRAEESSNAPGFRALVHPSAVESISQDVCIPLTNTERSEASTHELNFVASWPTLRFDDESVVADVVNRITVMRSHVTSPRALRHYDATLNVIATFQGRAAHNT